MCSSDLWKAGRRTVLLLDNKSCCFGSMTSKRSHAQGTSPAIQYPRRDLEGTTSGSREACPSLLQGMVHRNCVHPSLSISSANLPCLTIFLLTQCHSNQSLHNQERRQLRRTDNILPSLISPGIQVDVFQHNRRATGK